MCWDRWESLSKLGRAHRIRMELMAQLQTQIRGSIETRFAMRAFPIAVWLHQRSGSCSWSRISQCILKGPAMQIQRHHITGGKRVLGKLRQE